MLDREMSTETEPSSHIPFLTRPVLERLGISTGDVVDSIERLIIGQRRYQVWCAPKVVVLPGDDRYLMATLAVATDPAVVVT
jgi:hypothetical protein